MTLLPHKISNKSTLVSATTFTSKEKDAETGFSYFGARYYDSDLSGLFMSVDPMADKYPSITPYAYCVWNSLRLVDPDGKDVVLSESAQKIHEKYYGKEGYEKYTELYDKLNDDHSILINVKECNNNAYAKSIGANGVVEYSAIQQDKFKNGCFDVEWGDPNDMHGGKNEHVFFEELFHAGQMKDANYDLSAAHSKKVSMMQNYLQSEHQQNHLKRHLTIQQIGFLAFQQRCISSTHMTLILLKTTYNSE